MTPTYMNIAPKTVREWKRIAAKSVIWVMALLVLGFTASHRMIRGTRGVTLNEEGDDRLKWYKDTDKLWGGVNWWDLLYSTCMWAPLGVMALAAMCIYRHGDDFVLNALKVQKNNKKERSRLEKTRGFRDRLWKPRWVVGKDWYRSVWSWGDVIVALILLTCNLIWIVGVYVKGINGRREKWENEPPFERTRELLYRFAFWAGWAGMMNSAAAVVFTLRENHLTKVTMGPEGGEYFHGIRYHIALGYLAFGIFTFHSLVILGYDLNEFGPNETLNPTTGWLGHTSFWGLISYSALSIMTVTSLYKVRRWSYRVFYWSHQLYILYIFAACVHFNRALIPIVGAFFYFTFDRLLPYLNFGRRNRSKLTRVADEIVRLDVPRKRLVNQEYAPGDWVNLNFPAISYFNWHPYSLGSYYGLNKEMYAIFIKRRGAWTTTLVNTVPVNDSIKIDCFVEGPFGARSRTYLDSDMFTVVGAGTGVVAVVPYAIHYARNRPFRPVKIVWIARSFEDVACYPELFKECLSLSDNGYLELDLYLTRESMPKDSTTYNVESNAVVVSVEALPVAGETVSSATGEVDVSSSDDTPATASEPMTSMHGSWEKATTRQWVFRIFLVLTVFGIGLFNYMWMKSLQDDSDLGLCDDWTNLGPEPMPLTADQIFDCFYWPPLTLVFGILSAAVLGLLVALLYAHLSGIPASADVQVPANLARSVLRSYRVGRPDLKKMVSDLRHEAGPGNTIGMMGAGPERLMAPLEKQCGSTPYLTFYRESWKV